MNYNNQKLISALAAEYVLGTLRGKARDRFEKLKFANSAIANETAYWESQLNTLSLQIEPVQPNASVWANISQRIGFSTASDSDQAHTDKVVPDIQQTQINQTSAWKWMSGLATAASVVLAILLFVNTQLPIEQPIQSVAQISNQDSVPLWTFEVLPEHIEIKTTSEVALMPNNDYQLWIVPASGEAPISIGVMQQSGSYKLKKPLQYDRIEIAALAVSKEPKGGSLTGAPTQVLYATKLAVL